MKKLMRLGAALSVVTMLALGGCAQSSNQSGSTGGSGTSGLVETKEPKKVTEEELTNKLQTLMEKSVEEKVSSETDKQSVDMAKEMASKLLKPMSKCMAKLMIENDEQDAIKEVMKTNDFKDVDDLDKKLKNPEKMNEGLNACMKESGLDNTK